jgi:hypothetical protein
MSHSLALVSVFCAGLLWHKDHAGAAGVRILRFHFTQLPLKVRGSFAQDCLDFDRYSTCCHTFRATGITTYLQNGSTLEHAQGIANHESPRTTKLYDRTREEFSFEEVERIKI